MQAVVRHVHLAENSFHWVLQQVRKIVDLVEAKRVVTRAAAAFQHRPRKLEGYLDRGVGARMKAGSQQCFVLGSIAHQATFLACWFQLATP
jgi:hypothetical protein